jgi:hypothetical protein
VCGDFNEALTQDEHSGPVPRSDAQMELFRQCLDDCGLVDMGFSGPLFTWSNRQNADARVRVRLDGAVANGEFNTLFDDANVENIITTTTDHFAILVRLQSFGRPDSRKPVQSGFHFEAAWLRAPDYRDMMEKAWGEVSDGSLSLQATWDNLGSVAVRLQRWSQECFGSVWKEIKNLESKLRSLRLHPWSAANDLAASTAERRLCELFEREEIIARQRSRVEWLKEGDHNTAFFSCTCDGA